MARRVCIYQTDEAVRSFSTSDPRALIGQVRWVATPRTTMGDLLERVFDEGISDLLVVDPDTGRVVGIFGNFETSMVTNSLSKKKWEELTQAQVSCHDECVAACAQRGGCASHAIVGRANGKYVCAITCKDAEGLALEDALSTI